MVDETTQLFLEDFTEGQIFASPSRTITAADVLAFAALTGDAHPLHYDDEYAKTTRFGRPIVHGLHLMALTALGAAPLAERLEASMIAFLELEASFRKPVFKDDTLHPQFEVEGTEHKPGVEWGKLAIKVRLINQRDEIVVEGRHVYRILCRTPAR
jgi:3-hydroxybutyryl-CoA dehydratase